MDRAIYFDMDGTIADLYAVEGWLEDLRQYNARPYAQAKTLVNMNSLARQLKRLQRIGYKIGIISWLSKVSDDAFSAKVTAVKMQWLRKHLASVNFDEIKIVPYGTPKYKLGYGILFDDEERNRADWSKVADNLAFDEKNILNILKNIV